MPVDPGLNGEACTTASHCASGFCVDGVCCYSLCGSGATDCQACSRAQNGTTNGTCTPLRSARECRPAAGLCDAAESCSTSSRSCPTDRKKAAGTPCGTIPSPNENGVAECTGFDVCTRHCDVTEVCSGSSNACFGGIEQQPWLRYGNFNVSVNDGLQLLTDIHLLDTAGKSCEPGLGNVLPVRRRAIPVSARLPLREKVREPRLLHGSRRG